MIAVYMIMIVIESKVTIRGMKRYRTQEEAERAMGLLIAHFIDELGPFAFGYVRKV